MLEIRETWLQNVDKCQRELRTGQCLAGRRLMRRGGQGQAKNHYVRLSPTWEGQVHAMCDTKTELLGLSCGKQRNIQSFYSSGFMVSLKVVCPWFVLHAMCTCECIKKKQNDNSKKKNLLIKITHKNPNKFRRTRYFLVHL